MSPWHTWLFPAVGGLALSRYEKEIACFTCTAIYGIAVQKLVNRRINKDMQKNFSLSLLSRKVFFLCTLNY